MSSVLSHSFKLQGFLLCIPSHSTLKFQVFVVTPLALHAIQTSGGTEFLLYRRIIPLAHPYLISQLFTLLSTQLHSSHAQVGLWEFREVLQRH